MIPPSNATHDRERCGRTRSRRIDETRHTFATLAITAGRAHRVDQPAASNSNIQTTLKHYARWLLAATQMYVAVLARLPGRTEEAASRRPSSLGFRQAPPTT